MFSLIFFFKKKQTKVLLISVIKKKIRGWGDGSVVKTTYYSSKGPEFDSQHPCQMASLTPEAMCNIPDTHIHTHN